MRINKFVALATGMSRRAADSAIQAGRVKVNGIVSDTGQDVSDKAVVTFDDKTIRPPDKTTTIMLNKPAGYVVSRDGQGNQTIYKLLPDELHDLKPVGRLDKDSSGLLLLTNNGDLAYQLTHPSMQKEKVYKLSLDKALSHSDATKIQQGIKLDDGLSQLNTSGDKTSWTVRMHEGRNRQIRRTFGALGYKIVSLHRIQFGSYQLGELTSGKYQIL